MCNLLLTSISRTHWNIKTIQNLVDGTKLVTTSKLLELFPNTFRNLEIPESANKLAECLLQTIHKLLVEFPNSARTY